MASWSSKSTGKSTLSRQLAAHFQTQWVPEWARDYLAPRGAGVQVVRDDIEVIAKGQLESEETLARLAHKVLFCDTDVWTTTLYARHYFDFCPLWMQRLANERRYDLYLLMQPDIAWQEDAQRDSPAFQKVFQARVETELRSRRIPFTPIGGIGETRLENAIAVIEEFLARG